MAEKSLFFNALPDANFATGYDRNYNADDISDWLSVAYETGVVKESLKITALTGMNIRVESGKAAIKGKPYINEPYKDFVVSTAPTGANSRYDLIVLKYDNNLNERSIKLELRKGLEFSGTPTDQQFLNQLVREGDVHELLIGYVRVDPNLTTITQGHIGDRRSNKTLCGWFTAVKGYDDYYDAMIQKYTEVVNMTATGRRAITKISTNLYNNKYSIVNVYTNGIKEPSTNYELQVGSAYIVVNFNANKAAGTQILVELENFIDGEGMSAAIDNYNSLIEDVANAVDKTEYTYLCNGQNDNILIGNIARAYLQAATSGDYGTIKLKIVGTIGMTAPARGAGTASNPYGWFDLNIESNRNVILDFTCCSQIAPPIANGTYNIIFYSNNDCHVIGANVVANNTSEETIIRVMDTSSGVITFEDCRFWVTAYRDSLIALRGTFKNCRGSVANLINNSYCFLPSGSGILRLFGGEYYAYCGASTLQSSIVGQSSANAVSILYGVNAPTVARGGFYQTNSILQWTGGGYVNCTDLISALPMVVVAGISNIRGTIPYSKAGAM